MSEPGYPGTFDVDGVCVKCQRPFTVPVAFLAPNRPLTKLPEWCPVCVSRADELEAKRVAAEEAARSKMEAERKASSVLERVELAGGNPYEYADFTLEGFRPKAGREKAHEATVEWVTTVLSTRDKYAKVRGLYLVGDTGTAKTALAHCALRTVLEAGMEPVKHVLFDDSLSLIERIQGTYGSDESTWKLLEARIFARVWILDDFMAEKPSDDVIRKLTLIFNRREGKPTMVTSNHPPDELRARHKEAFRLLSRFGVRQFRTVGVHGDDGRFDRDDVRRVAAQ